MLGSFLRITLFILVLAGLSLGAVFLTENGQSLRITTLGKEFNLGALQIVVGMMVLVLLFWLLLIGVRVLAALLALLFGDRTAFVRLIDRNRERRGFDSLAESLSALASGDPQNALRSVLKADKLLHRRELTDALLAQAAVEAGDQTRAEAVFRRMLDADKTRFMGIRGLLRLRMASEDHGQALQLAERAFEIKPHHIEVQDTLLRLQVLHHDWKGARATLKRKQTLGLLPKPLWKRRDSVLALGEAIELREAGQRTEGDEIAIQANRQTADLVPGAVMAAEALASRGRAKDAARVLKTCWQAAPHPDLARAFVALAPDEDAAKRLTRLQNLVGSEGDTPLARQVLAEALAAAEDFPAARRMLAPLLESEKTAPILSLMALIERGIGAPEHEIRSWLAKAVTAPRGPQWVCDTCETIAPVWSPACPNCHAIDQLSWRRAKGSPEALSGPDVTLPLLSDRMGD